MGVYSNSRFLNESYVDVPEPDLHYRGVDGANRLLTEMVQNDLAFFDAIIMNDIQEAYMVNAIKEGATDLIPEVYALQEAAGGGIFSKIAEFLKSIWKKISGLIMSFINKITGSLTSDNKKLVKKFEKQIQKKEDALKKMDFKWADFKDGRSEFGFKQTLDLGAIKADSAKNALVEKAKDGTNMYYTSNKIGHTSDKAFWTEFGKDIKELMDYNDDPSFNFNVYKTYLDDNAPNSSSELPKFIHDFFFKDEETKHGEFNRKVDEIKKALNDSKTTIKNLENNKRDIDKFFKENIKNCEDIAKASDKEDFSDSGNMIVRTMDKDQNRHGGTYDDTNGTTGLHYSKPTNTYNDSKDYNDSSMQHNVDGVDKNPRQMINKAANVTKTYYSKMQNCVTELLNGQMAAVQFYIKQCRRVWIQAASYSANHESALMEAVGESADFDTDQLFEAFN